MPHSDYFGDPAERSFLYDVAHQMYRAGHLTPYLLLIGGRPVAGQLVLHANATSFFSVPGADPAWGPYSVGTVLMAECLSRSVERGDHQANLSIGPDAATLRWSEHLHHYQDFVVVGQRRRSRLAMALLRARRGADLIRRDGLRGDKA